MKSIEKEFQYSDFQEDLTFKDNAE